MILPVAIFVAEVVILITTHQYDAARLLVTEKGDSIVSALLQIAKTHDIAAYLDGVENAIRAGIGLNQPVHFQIFVHP